MYKRQSLTRRTGWHTASGRSWVSGPAVLIQRVPKGSGRGKRNAHTWVSDTDAVRLSGSSGLYYFSGTLQLPVSFLSERQPGKMCIRDREELSDET